MDEINTLEVIVDGSQGIHVPELFIKSIIPEEWNIKGESVEDIKKGPDSDLYWEAWDEIIRTARRIKDGKEYSLYQDDDLFINELIFCDECDTGIVGVGYKDERRTVCSACVNYDSERAIREVIVTLPKEINGKWPGGPRKEFTWKLFQLRDDNWPFIHIGSKDANFWFTVDGNDEEKAYNELVKLIKENKNFAGAEIKIDGRGSESDENWKKVKILLHDLDGTISGKQSLVIDHLKMNDWKNNSGLEASLMDFINGDFLYRISIDELISISVSGETVEKKELFLHSQVGYEPKGIIPGWVFENWKMGAALEIREAIESILNEEVTS